MEARDRGRREERKEKLREGGRKGEVEGGREERRS